MSQGRHSKRSQRSNKRLTGVQVALRFLMLSVVIALLVVAGTLLYTSFNRRGEAVPVRLGTVLNPLEAVYLSTYLGMNADALNTPLNPDDTLQRLFEVRPGETAGQVGDKLADAGLISDAALFVNYLRYYSLDRELDAGLYELAPSMTIPEIASILAEGRLAEITVQVIEGWRREQIAGWIDQQPGLPFTGAQFLAATDPGSLLPAEAGIAADVPAGASLEGFLFPDTYRLPADSSAEDLVQRMLENYAARITTQMRADAAERGFTMHQVLTLASIVEREARVADERPAIASVYLNRLAIGMKLDADPTVQYAMGYQPNTGEWWNLALTQADYYSVDSPFNTYLYPGLPPAPIASPGLDAIMAVIYPAETPYFYFRAACDGSGRHNFAVTFEEHVANACP